MAQVDVEYRPGDIVDGHIKVCENGAGYDLSAKRFSHPPGTFCEDVPNGQIKTTEHAQTLARRRHEKAQEKTRQEIIKRFQESGDIPEEPDIDFSDAVAIVGGEAMVSAMANMMEKPREAVRAGSFGLKLAGAGELIARPQSINADTLNIIQVNVGGELVDAPWQELSDDE